MVTFIQAISNVGGVATVSPLHPLGNVSQTGQVTTSAEVAPSSITTLGATGNTTPLTFDVQTSAAASSLTGLVSGLTPEQQRQLALSLGLDINATSADLNKAIDALLTPANPAQLFGTSTTTASDLTTLLQNLSPTSSLTDFTSGLAPAQQRQLALALGLNSSATSADITQALNALLTPASPLSGFVSGLTPAQQQQLALSLGLNANATSTDLTNAINALLLPANPGQALLDILVGGTTTETTPTAAPGQVQDENELAGVPASTTEEILESFLTPTAGPATTTTVISTGTATAPIPLTNPSAATAGQIAGAATATPAATTAANPTAAGLPSTPAAAVVTTTAITPPTVTSATVPITATTAAIPAAAASAASQTASATVAIPATAAPVTATAVATPTTPTAAATSATPATAIASISATILTIPTAATTAATPPTPIAATLPLTVTSVTAPATVATVATQVTTAVVTANANVTENLPATAITATGAQTTTPVAQPAPLAVVITLAAIEAPVAAIVPPITTAPAPTPPVTTSPPPVFSNADNVLQALLADAASHALITSNQAAATYATPGTVFQLSSGIDHTRQADLAEKLADIRGTLNPVTRVASVRGALERQS